MFAGYIQGVMATLTVSEETLQRKFPVEYSILKEIFFMKKHIFSVNKWENDVEWSGSEFSKRCSGSTVILGE